MSTPHPSALAQTQDPDTSGGCFSLNKEKDSALQALAFRPPDFREMFVPRPVTLTLTSESIQPGDNPLALECLLLGFLIDCLCSEGKQFKGEEEGDYFKSEDGKNKDNIF